MTPAEYRVALPGGDELVATAGSVLVAVGENDSGLGAAGRGVARRIAAAARGVPAFGYVGRRRGLSPTMDVAENVFMGRERTNDRGLFRFGIDWKRTRSDAQALLQVLGSSLSPLQKAGDLSEFDRLIVELARALARDAVLVLVDEPTARLGGDESLRLIAALQAMAARGIAVVVLSQRPREALGYADELVVVRDAAVVGVHRRDEWVGDPERMRQTVLREMVEQPGLGWPVDAQRESLQPDMLRIAGWTVFDPVERGDVVQQADLVVREGEIVGIAGLRDSGSETLLLNVYGLSDGVKTAGTVAVRGEAVDTSTVEKAIAAGLFLVSMDPPRYRVRFIGGVAMPVAASSVPRLAKMGLIDRYSDTDPSGGLGGKMLGAVRSISRSGDEAEQIRSYVSAFPQSERLVLMLGNPTRGLTSDRREEVHRGLRTIAAGGKSVVLTSDDLTELFAVCDRVITMAEGRITGELTRAVPIEPAPIDPAHLAALLAPR